MKPGCSVLQGEGIAEKRAGVRKTYVPDPLGSTVALLDNTQAQTDTFTYWPYGEVKTRTGSTATPFQFVGTRGYYHDSSSRDYVRARHLRKDLGRWQTEDPIGFRGGDQAIIPVSIVVTITMKDKLYIQRVLPTVRMPPDKPKFACLKPLS